MSSCGLLLSETAAVSLPWTGIEPGLPSLPILRSEPRSGDDRVGDEGGFCNNVGGVISPLLANIYLDRLDKYVERALIPEHTRGERRRVNPEYQRIANRISYLKRQGADEETLTPLRKRLRGT